MKINKAKRKVVIRALVAFGLKPMSKIDEIMTRFALVGPRAQAKPIKAAAEAADGEDEEGKDQGDLPPIDDEAE